MVSAAAGSLGTPSARGAAVAIRADFAGAYHALEQSRLPTEPIGQAAQTYRWRFDPAAGALIREAEQEFPGRIRFFTRHGITPAGGWRVDLIRWRTGTDLATQTAREALQSRLLWERYLPHLLMRQAEAGTEVQATGAAEFRFTDEAGDPVEVTLDPVTQRPLRARQKVNGGTVQLEFRYADYRRRHGVLVPQQVQLYVDGRLQEDLRLGRTAPARIAARDLQPPPGYSPPPPPGQPTARELAPGVFFFDNMPGGYHSMAIDAGDHLLLLEAPLSPAYAAAQRSLLEKLRPGKSVRYVLVTHHHGDHVGGLRSWAEAGATIIVAEGARAAIVRQLRARGYEGEIRIEEVVGQRMLGSEASRLVAYAFDGSHARSQLLMHLPGPGILFQGDLFYLPERGSPPPAFPVVTELEQQIRRLSLRVETIVGVHGRPGSMADLRRSLALGRR